MAVVGFDSNFFAFDVCDGGLHAFEKIEEAGQDLAPGVDVADLDGCIDLELADVVGERVRTYWHRWRRFRAENGPKGAAYFWVEGERHCGRVKYRLTGLDENEFRGVWPWRREIYMMRKSLACEKFTDSTNRAWPGHCGSS